MIELLVKTGEEYKRLEQTDSVNYALTRMFQDLEDPLAIVCDHSSTFKVPATPVNLAALGYASIVEFSTSVGVTKFDIMLVEGSVVIADGEGHLGRVFRENGLDWLEMSITSYSNKAMKCLQSMRWRENIPEDNVDDLIAIDDESETFNLDAAFVQGANLSNDYLLKFTPAFTGLPQRIDTTKYWDGTGAIKDLKDYKMPNTGKTIGKQFEDNKKDFEATLGDGITSMNLGEWRSYDLVPLFNMKGIIGLMSQRLNEREGWKIDTSAIDNILHHETTEAPKIHYDIQMVGKRLQVKPNLDDTENYKVFKTITEPITGGFGYKYTSQDGSAIKAGTMVSLELEDYPSRQVSWDGVNQYDYVIDDHIDTKGYLYMRFHVVDGSNNVLGRYVICTESYYNSIKWGTAPFEFHHDFVDIRSLLGDFEGETDPTSPTSVEVEYYSELNLNFIVTNDTTSFSVIFDGTSTAKALDVVLKGMPAKYNPGVRPTHKMPFTWGDIFTLNFANHNPQVSEKVDPTYGCSYGSFWDASETPLKKVTDFTKQFNIVWVYDQNTKTIVLKPKSEWLQEGTTLRIDDRIDYSKDYSMDMYTSKDKYLVFNYDKNDTDQGQKEKETELFYGSQRYLLPTDTTKSTKNYFKGLRSPISRYFWILTLDDLISKVDRAIPDFDFNNVAIANYGIYLQNKTDFVDGFGELFEFMRFLPVQPADTFPVWDDTTEERQSRSFCIQKLTGRQTPHMVPNPGWPTGLTFQGTCPVHWSTEINQLYGKDARAITCWFRLSPVEFHDFKFNNRYLIGNSAWRCLSLTDYDPNTGFAKATFSKLTQI